MARLYTNENFPLKATLLLRALGHDVLTSQEAGNANQAIPDAEVLRFAAEIGRAVLTINKRDFIRLHPCNHLTRASSSVPRIQISRDRPKPSTKRSKGVNLLLVY
jgi:hypothetical protein